MTVFDLQSYLTDLIAAGKGETLVILESESGRKNLACGSVAHVTVDGWGGIGEAVVIA